MNFWRDAVRSQDYLKRREQHLRRIGYDDGFAGRPAAVSHIVYAQAWKRGREARQAIQDGAA